MKSRPDFTVYDNLSSRFIPGMMALCSMVDNDICITKCPAYKLRRSNKCTFGLSSGNFNFLTETIAHLNDVHGWTFDEVADWIEESGFNIKLPDRNFVLN